MAAQIIRDHKIASPQGWGQKAGHPCQKAGRIDRAIEHAWGDDAVASQRGDKSQRLPMTIRHFGNQTAADGAASVHTGHVCFGPCLVDKDQALGINVALQPFPLLTPPLNVRTILLAGVQSFF